LSQKSKDYITNSNINNKTYQIPPFFCDIILCMKINQKGAKKIAQKYQLDLLILFGSRVKVKKFLTDESDFDIAYRAKKDLQGKEMINLNCDLMGLFKNDRVDIVDIKKADPLLKFAISRNSKLIYGDEIEYLNFKSSAFKSYIDAQPLFDLESKFIAKRQEALRGLLYD